ncbi:acyl carrier protein [Streptomyces aureocirculatus]|uniref:acyl carrier protein n=1 Tax=Streptomyces aureocirculatus TaxID=67275 RepID=UPI0005675045|nr:acyl carrier protein [Streptomyces aureocirculatus]
MEHPVLPEQFVQLMHELFQIEAEQLTPSTTFEDLGMDSLALMELVVAAEDQYGLVLPEHAMDMTPATTLEEARCVLSAAVPKQQPSDAASTPLTTP